MKQFLEEISAIQGQEIFTSYMFFSNVTPAKSIRLVLSSISFKLAVENTARKRGSLDILADYKSICAEIIMYDNLRRLWRNYCASEPYAARFSFIEVADNVLSVGEYLSRISLSDN